MLIVIKDFFDVFFSFLTITNSVNLKCCYMILSCICRVALVIT